MSLSGISSTQIVGNQETTEIILNGMFDTYINTSYELKPEKISN